MLALVCSSMDASFFNLFSQQHNKLIYDSKTQPQILTLRRASIFNATSATVSIHCTPASLPTTTAATRMYCQQTCGAMHEHLPPTSFAMNGLAGRRVDEVIGQAVSQGLST